MVSNKYNELAKMYSSEKLKNTTENANNKQLYLYILYILNYI
jgi:hypothetical protein